MEPRVSGTHADAICGRLGFDNWIRVESLGFSGGIWIFWTENNFSIQLIESHPQFFACKVLPVSGVSWNFCFIYASPYSPCRRILWTDLKLDSVDLSDEWMALGDFNCVPFQSELQGYNTFNISGAKLFSDWIFDNGLLDMGFEGSAFTWSRGLSSHSLQRARLDRALCSPNWQFRFPHAYVTHPAKFHSDHCPLVVSLNRHVHRMEGPFRFQLAWMNHADLGMINLASNLRLWNRNSFGNIFSRKKRISARIAGIQKTLSTGGPQHLLKLELKLKKQLEDILEQEELFWFQKSKEDWIVSGDRNTWYYHLSTLVRNKKSPVTRLMDDMGNWIEDSIQLQALVRDFYCNLYTLDRASELNRARSGLLTRLNSTHNLILNEDFSRDEVTAAFK
ncbi:uncharacterized protein LOC110621511 [Manihot esculenta]|uniref:uncharacterized protein LOC110621511 n=1 Tax=Manihot esculenta TaxID=3983 RepID=UPI000B5D44E6|nr:uncharacterized protein LOC110621511 [Manihot esculenta]